MAEFSGMKERSEMIFEGQVISFFFIYIIYYQHVQ